MAEFLLWPVLCPSVFSWQQPGCDPECTSHPFGVDGGSLSLRSVHFFLKGVAL